MSTYGYKPFFAEKIKKKRGKIKKLTDSCHIWCAILYTNRTYVRNIAKTKGGDYGTLRNNCAKNLYAILQDN